MIGIWNVPSSPGQGVIWDVKPQCYVSCFIACYEPHAQFQPAFLDSKTLIFPCYRIGHILELKYFLF